MIYRLLILFGLVLAGIAVWLTLSLGQLGPVTAQTSRTAARDQGYSATDASLEETGADGRPLYTLQARRARQEPDDDTIHLETVHMTFRDTSGGQWQARADQAIAQQDAALIDLAGAVDISGTFAGSDQPAHILTQKVHVDTRTEVISNRSAVTLNWAGIEVRAPNLVVNTKDHSVKLNTDTHAHTVR